MIRKTKRRALVFSLFLVIGLFATLLAPKKAFAANYVVNTTADSGAGSLRQAITDANSNPGADQINFAIAASGQQTITLSGALPSITDPVTINGLSQTGSTCNGSSTQLNVALDLNTQINAFSISAGGTGSEINGLAIGNAGSNSYGLYVASGADSVVVRCNYFGTFDGSTNATSTTNTDYLQVDGDNATVGGSADTDTNLFLTHDSNAILATGGTSLTIEHNFIGTSLDGLSTLGVTGGIYFNGSYSSIDIDDNLITPDSGSSGVYFASTADGASNINITNNKIGTDITGNAALSNMPSAIRSQAALTNLNIVNNVLASTLASSSAISIADDVTGGTVQGNMINVSSDGSSSFAGSAGFSTSGGTQSDWLIDGNTIYASFGYGISLDASDSLVTNNTVGMDVTRTSCFSDQVYGINFANSTETVIGGTGVGDGNYICTDGVYDGIKGTGASADNVSLLGNRVNAAHKAIDQTSEISRPILTNVATNGGNTDIDFDVNLAAGDYRIEFFENDSLINSANYSQLQTYIGSATFTASGGAESFTKTISGNGYTYVTATVTEVDGSSDGYGATSEAGNLQQETDLNVTTTDSVDYVEPYASNHSFVQTITNGGSVSISRIGFNLTDSTCLSISSITPSGSATNTGTYSSSNWNGVLDPGQTLIITITGDISCDLGNTVSLFHQISYIGNSTSEVSDTNLANNSYGNFTDVQHSADLGVDTTDGVTTVAAGTTGHTITQTLTNNGASTITDINFSLDSSDCFAISNIAVDGSSTATDPGSYTGDPDYDWSGTLAEGETLVLVFTGDTSCGNGNTITFTHTVSGLQYSGENVVDINTDASYTDTTSIIAPASDLAVTKSLENPEDLAVGALLNYDITFTNNGPIDQDLSIFAGNTPGQDQLFLDIMPADLTYISYTTSEPNIDCTTLGPTSASYFGAALATHSDHELAYCWETSGSTHMLASGDSFTVTLTLQVTNGSSLDFINYVLGNHGQNDPSQNALDGYLGDSDIIDLINDYNANNPGSASNNLFGLQSVPVADIGLTKTAVEPFAGDTPGATVSYDVTFTNNGPMDIDLTLFDGQNQTNNLFADFYPGDALTYVSSDNNDIYCLDIGLASSVLVGAMGNHPNHHLLVCVYVGPSANLASGGSYTTRLNFTVNNNIPSSYTNYAVFYGDEVIDPESTALVNAFANTSGDVLDGAVDIAGNNYTKVTYTAENDGNDANQTDTDNSGIDASTLSDTGENKQKYVILASLIIVIGIIGAGAYGVRKVRR